MLQSGNIDMRVFSERDERSRFYGEHIVYDSEKEFETEHPGVQWRIWGNGDPADWEIGDWFRADDGYIIELLGIKYFPAKTEVEHGTYFFRVPMGTFACWWVFSRKKWKWRQLFAQFSVPSKNSASQISRIYHGGHIEKIKFANLIIAGINPTTAVRMTFPNLHRLTKSQLLIKAAKLMADEVVQTEIRLQIDKFKNDIVDKFGDKRLLEELDSLLTHSKKGTDAHRSNIQFIMELRGLYSTQKNSKKLPEGEDTDYTEVPQSEAEK